MVLLEGRNTEKWGTLENKLQGYFPDGYRLEIKGGDKEPNKNTEYTYWVNQLLEKLKFKDEIPYCSSFQPAIYEWSENCVFGRTIIFLIHNILVCMKR